MANVMLHTFELSDFEKVVEQVLERKLKSFIPQEKEKLTLLTRKDTAKLLRISLPTLHDWTKTGIVKAHRIGNRILYKLEEVNQALSQIQTSTKRGGLQC
ncbi:MULTISPECIES: helix-turn-helix domain-containing protein [unclassified Leeuwenhoekiella]|uniref:helix-turn-helix domain-containing protein n=1 Tax=unclassified Leeuwenhoekiella TaxID=2615029 RepID=UPI000C100636|nr:MULTISPECIES: helix-turn-helix domain-containing protein [unclassified Leeuwenhoekiella]MAW95960.1 excisionase [Leeuwenhoekiella sp.]MBA79954.1 excisionase [Leeuwenhoekiella sp.]PHR93131.1 MAG: excisionase [Leeuwenhoekiella sp.]|tara:strand:- start:7807 stop:8106 length:300 start_codon:yes stop_codon:yes gene_type:complete